jgi:hypothetical protein
MKSISLILCLFFLQTGAAFLKADEIEYVGSRKCKMCHIKQYNTWKTSKMALAFESLKPGVSADAKQARGLNPDKDYTSNEECLPCHTTGFGKPGGYLNIEETPDLAGVGCEACHGPGKEYLKTDLMSLKNKDHSLESVRAAGLIYPVDRETCESQCHNEESPFVSADQEFDFDKRKMQGVHESVALKYKHE